MKTGQYLHWIICPLFMLSCAKQTSPTGGPKDTIPPTLLTSRPLNQQTHFSQSTIELTFDEQLLLNNPKEQIIINPDTDNPFEAVAKKNTVTIKFESPFNSNTTYAINFREAIQDITEKNPAENLKIAFSTGDYIDSLKIEGTVIDLLKSQEIKDATVALYQVDTFNIFKHKPTYFTKTDKKGNFQITNLKPGDYYLYAIDDKNKNLVVESKSEAYGFQTERISLTQNINNATLPLIRLDTRDLKLTSARPSGTSFNIKTSKNLKEYSVESQDGKPLYSSFAEDFANIRIYNTASLKDSTLIRFRATDSLVNQIDTLLYLKFSTRTSTPDKFQITNSTFRILESKGTLTGQIIFNKPLLDINFDSIFYQIDSLRIIPISAENIRIDSLNNKLTISKTLSQEQLQTTPTTQGTLQQQPPKPKPISKSQTTKFNENHFYIAAKTFISAEKDSSTRLSESLKPTTLESTGVILTNIKTKATHYIIQLLTRDFQIVHSSYNTPVATFEDLQPGDYRIRLIIDDNQDGEWTPGNFFKNQQPETAIFYKNDKQNTVITLKANWELGPLLITY
jgi:uncharacterized protein (DUF2141 family)